MALGSAISSEEELLPMWHLDALGDPLGICAEHIAQLNIPSVCDVPSLLLHDLGRLRGQSSFQERLKTIFDVYGKNTYMALADTIP